MVNDIFPWLSDDCDDEIEDPEGMIVDPDGAWSINDHPRYNSRPPDIDQAECDDDEIIDLEGEPAIDDDPVSPLLTPAPAWSDDDDNEGEEYDLELEDLLRL